MRTYEVGEHIVYGILGELFYAVVKNPNSTFPAPNYVTIQTLYSFYAKYDDGEIGLSPESELEIKYIKGKVPPNLSKEKIFDDYPEYIV